MSDLEHLPAAISLSATLANNVEHHDEILQRTRRFLVGRCSITAGDLAVVLRCDSEAAKCWLRALGDFIIHKRGWYRFDHFRYTEAIESLANKSISKKSTKRPGSA